METIARRAAGRASGTVKQDEDELKASVNKFSERVKKDSESYRTSAHLLDDGIIDPRDTREVLGMCLEVVTIDPIKGNPGFNGLSRI